MKNQTKKQKKHKHHFIKKRIVKKVSQDYEGRILFVFPYDYTAEGERFIQWEECKCGKIKNAKWWGTKFLSSDTGSSDMIDYINEENAIKIYSYRELLEMIGNDIGNDDDLIEQE